MDGQKVAINNVFASQLLAEAEVLKPEDDEGERKNSRRREDIAE